MHVLMHPLTPAQHHAVVILGRVVLIAAPAAFLGYMLHIVGAFKGIWKLLKQVRWLPFLGAMGKVLLGFLVVWLAPFILFGFGVYWLYQLGGYACRFVQNGFRPPSEDA